MMTDYLDIEYLKWFHSQTGLYPKYFGLGFFQLKLNEEKRIHYYHKDMTPLLDQDEIHDHRYGFESAILKGTLTNRVWYYEPTEESDWELVEVHCKEGQDDFPVTIVPSVRKVYLGTFNVNNAYVVSPDLFHQVQPVDHVVSLLKRGPIVRETARVIRNKTVPYTCPFSRKYSLEETWELIEEILED